jgi:hypothetical protein
MVSFTEMQGQSNLLHKSGTVEINTDCYRQRRPAWLVLLKLLGVAAMVAVGKPWLTPREIMKHLHRRM